MTLNFYKYQGTGNDFIIIDNREGNISLSTKQVRKLCDRKFGIGADGLMLLQLKTGYDFEMIYFNADGKEGSMCGNGGRCLVKFAFDMGMRKSDFVFLATDGEHIAEINEQGIVSLKMINVDGVQSDNGDLVLNTGSPHYIKQVADVNDMDVYHEGMGIRFSDTYCKEGINVNFVQVKDDDELIVRTYERGVEDETLSCGTGVTAAALAFYHNEMGYNNVTVHTRGGVLRVEYDRTGENEYRNIWLSGPAERVFEGTVQLDLETV